MMARPLRIEFSGALYHVTARGNERKCIFYTDRDREYFLKTLSNACVRYRWLCHGYCLMGNHYHLLLETSIPNLSKGMHYLNGRYSQWFNATHSRVGHLFQGRFKSILVEKEAYLLELSRYIVLNPVRAGFVKTAREWAWSSYRGMAGHSEPHTCLSIDWILSRFSGYRSKASMHYRQFVAAGKNIPAPWDKLKNEIYLGSDQFVEDALQYVDRDEVLKDIPRLHTLAPRKPLEYYLAAYADTDLAMIHAYLSGHYTLDQVGDFFGKGRSTVSRKVKAYEDPGKWEA
jgi:REP element-mobilizing transposase RayT